MSTKTFSNVRTKQKHDIEFNWLKATGFTPLDGELIVYDVDETHSKPRLKIGNGEQNVNLLPFIGSDIELKSGTNVEINKNEDGSYTISAIYTLPQATEENLGGVKIGYTQVDKNYPIVLDTNGKAYVNVPWTDTQQNSFSKFSFIDGENKLTIEALNSTDTLKIQVGSGLDVTTNIAGDEFILSAEVTKSYVDEVIANLVDAAPDTLNTLNELAAALGNDENFATTIATQIGKKVDKVEGKDLSTNDFTNEDKEKLDKIDEEIKNIQFLGIGKGNPISLDDASDNNLFDLHLYGKTTQDGTPSPTNPIPLVNAGDSGEVNVQVCGKNLLKNTATTQTINGVSFTVNDDKSITIKGTATANINLRLMGDYTNTEPVFYYKGGTTYTASLSPVDAGVGLLFHSRQDGTWKQLFNVVTSKRFTPETDGYFTDILLSIASGKTVDVTVYPQLELGDIATEYEPVKIAQTLTIQTPNGLPGISVTSGGNYTDENGQQWICDEIDFERGVRIQWCVVISSYDGEYIDTPYISSTGELSAGAEVIYALTEPIETPLTAEEIAAYKALHTNKPVTTILNDGGADMTISYVPNTDSGKYISKIRSIVVDNDAQVSEDTLLVIDPDAVPDKIPEWYNGTAVTSEGQTAVEGSSSGDYYINTNTFDVYHATAENTWEFIGNIKGGNGSTGIFFGAYDGSDGEPPEDAVLWIDPNEAASDSFLTVEGLAAALVALNNDVSIVPNDLSGYTIRIGKVLIQTGDLVINPTAANTNTASTVVFPVAFAATPFVSGGLKTSVPQNISFTVSYGVTAERFTAVLRRSDGTTATGIKWIAVGMAV